MLHTVKFTLNAIISFFSSGERTKNYKCTFCTASYTTKSHLKFHMYKHTGDFPYSCSYCHKGFAGKSQLKYHELRHNGMCRCINLRVNTSNIPTTQKHLMHTYKWSKSVMLKFHFGCFHSWCHCSTKKRRPIS